MTSPLPAYNSMTASARIIPAKRTFAPQYDRWQEQAWDYYDRIGELEYGISWLANTMSRVRLLAAELAPGGNEPVPLDDGPAVEAMQRLAGGTGGQAQLMKEMTIHLSTPGEGWLVGERPTAGNPTGDHAANLTGEETWSVRSADELRLARKNFNGQRTYEVREEETEWRLISPDSLVVRFWDPHPRYGWQADSAVRHALSALLELDLINKRIIATIISRLVSNGILLYDKGKLSFPSQESQPEGGEEVDPFAQMLVDVASEGIKDPTSASAAIPIPIGFDLANMQDVDPRLLLQHITFDNALDEKLLAERDSAVRKLATSLDMPAEVLLGLGDVNHWSAWQIEESGIKVHVAPKAELISNSLTTGYLLPMLKASNADLRGPNGGKIVVWYDPSEITTRPDKSGSVREAYDRLEVSGEAYRREIGLTEDDKPEGKELFEQALKKIIQTQGFQLQALEALTGETIETITTSRSATGEGGEVEEVDESEVEERSMPGTQDVAPDEVDAPTVASALKNGALDFSTLDDDDAASLFAGLTDEMKRRFGGAEGSTWVTAGTLPDPDKTRVAPKRRDTGDELKSEAALVVESMT